MTFVVFAFSLLYPVAKRLKGIIDVCNIKMGKWEKQAVKVLCILKAL